MRAEFSIYPLSPDQTTPAPAIEGLEGSGPKVSLGRLSTVVEGTWNEVLATIQRCHQAVARTHERVVTTIVIDDRKPRRRNGSNRIARVEEQLADRVPRADMDLEC